MKGSFSKRVGKRGTVTWTCVLDLPSDPATGKRRQKRLSAPTRKALEALVSETLHEVHTDTYLEPGTTPLGAYLVEWLEAAEPTLRPASRIRYGATVHRHLVPGLGG